jgi:hypothetical protein
VNRLRQARTSRSASSRDGRTAAPERPAQGVALPAPSAPGQSGFGTGTAAPVQRRLLRFVNGGWREIEPGTAGTYLKPNDPKDGEYFNDLTGKRGMGLGDVREGLLDRMMHTGGLQDLSYRDESLVQSWESVFPRLRKAFGKKINVKKDDQMDKVGTLYLTEEGREGMEERGIAACGDLVLFWQTAGFVRQLMVANGQWDYLLGKEAWLKDGYHVQIDINYYYNRQIPSGGLGLHKDTGGDNIFVNLVFDNTSPTPGTEWTQDREIIDDPEDFKRQVMQDRVPGEMLEEIDKAKGLLHQHDVPGKEEILGGVLPKYGYVSWVDELIWHATPNFKNRSVYAPGDPRCGMLKELIGLNLTNEDYSNDDMDAPQLLDALVALSERPGSVLKSKIKDIAKMRLEFSLWQVWAWLQGHLDDHERQVLVKEIDGMMEARDTKYYSGRIGTELDRDEGQSLRLVRPTGVSKRRRSNSDLKTQKEISEALDESGERPRSFIRTWVRVMPGSPPNNAKPRSKRR